MMSPLLHLCRLIYRSNNKCRCSSRWCLLRLDILLMITSRIITIINNSSNTNSSSNSSINSSTLSPRTYSNNSRS